MNEEETGIKAIIALQKAGGIIETEEQARKGWKAMSVSERESTLQTVKVLCPDWSDKC